MVKYENKELENLLLKKDKTAGELAKQKKELVTLKCKLWDEFFILYMKDMENMFNIVVALTPESKLFIKVFRLFRMLFIMLLLCHVLKLSL
jgi:hypothetical protein